MRATTTMQVDGDADEAERETWLCRSTIGVASDVEVDDRAEEDDPEGEDERRGAENNHSDDQEEGERRGAENTINSIDSACDVNTHKATRHDHHSSKGKPARPLDLGAHLLFTRRYALKQRLPAQPTPTTLPTTRDGMSKKKRRNSVAIDKKMSRKMEVENSYLQEDDALAMEKKKTTENQDSDAGLPIYTDYDRPSHPPKRTAKVRTPREPFRVERTVGVNASLFLSTACVHCVSFNVSPALRRAFRIEGLPVGLCIVLAWTLLGLVNCVGAFIGRGGDRIALLRRLAWLWIAAIFVLQVAKVLPVAVWVANTLMGTGYVAAVVAHGVAVPHLVALGVEITSTKVKDMLQLPHNARSRQREQQTIDAAMGAFFTRAFAAVLIASSLVQAYYFAVVDLDALSENGLLVIRSQRSVFITIPCGALLSSLLITYLFLSRNHGLPQCETGPDVKTPPAIDARMQGLERKLALGDLEWNAQVLQPVAVTGDVAMASWLRLSRHSVALAVLTVFTLLVVLGVGASVVSHAIVSPTTPGSTTSTVAHLVIFGSLFLAWCVTTLLSAGQLSPASRDKVYANKETLVSQHLLPSRQHLFVFTALVCLASVSTFAAFIRAQMYSTLFVQNCQLHRPANAALLFDPNLLGSWIGLASSVCLPLVRSVRLGKCCQRPRVSAIRCVAVGVLLYLLAIFLASVVALYRRDSRIPVTQLVMNPVAAGCVKSRSSNFSVLWSLPHLVLLAIADALFRLGAAEEAYALTAPLNWLGIAQGVLAMADCVGYTLALSLSSTSASWLYRSQTSDLVLFLLMIAAVASLLYALTKRLADHVEASRRHQLQQLKHQDDNEGKDDEAKSMECCDDDMAASKKQYVREHESLTKLRPSVQVLTIDTR